jgi:RNA 2',3'-cyclic 3'-phosphodiesterase
MSLFVGIDLPNEIKHTLIDLQCELRQLGVNASWKSPENFHITLEFLGELEASNIQVLTETLNKAVKTNKKFKINIGGLGGFPTINRPHTLWTAIGGSLTELNQLQNNIHNELAKCGFVLEKRRFKPHISLASRPKLEGIDLSEVHSKKPGEFMVVEVVLFESKVFDGKIIYKDLHRTSLNTIG